MTELPQGSFWIHRWLVGPCVALLLVGSACGGTETGNPPALQTLSITLVMRSPTTGEAEGEKDTSRLPYPAIQSAWVATDSLKLQACAGGGEAEFSAWIWDLEHPVARTTAAPALAEFCAVTIRTRQAEATAGNIPPEMKGASLWIAARRRDGVAVEVRSIAVLDVSRTTMAPISGRRLTYEFDPGAWFSGLNLDAMLPDADGVIRLSSSSNPAALQLFEGQIGDQSELRERREEEDDDEDDDAFDD